MSGADAALARYMQRVAMLTPPPGAADDLAAAIRDDPGIAEAARARVAALSDDICKRCYISSRNRNMLINALAAASAAG